MYIIILSIITVLHFCFFDSSSGQTLSTPMKGMSERIGVNKMQFTISTDYAIRVVTYMAIADEKVNATQIGEAVHIPLPYTYKILQILRRGGVVCAEVGGNAGYWLAKDTKDISVYDVIVLTEKTMVINRCMEEDEYCSRGAVQTCSVRKMHGVLQTIIYQLLKSVSIDQLIHEDFKELQELTVAGNGGLLIKTTEGKRKEVTEMDQTSIGP